MKIPLQDIEIYQVYCETCVVNMICNSCSVCSKMVEKHLPWGEKRLDMWVVMISVKRLMESIWFSTKNFPKILRPFCVSKWRTEECGYHQFLWTFPSILLRSVSWLTRHDSHISTLDVLSINSTDFRLNNYLLFWDIFQTEIS